jgi:hypothetical protein
MGEVFRETQRFRQPWLWWMLIGSVLLLVGLFGWALIQQLVLGKPWGNKPMSDAALVATAVAVLALEVGVVLFFLLTRMDTVLDDSGLTVRLAPFRTRRIEFREISSIEAREYNALREYGGWGIRYGRKGMAYNVSGNKGVQLHLCDGRVILIGSQRAEQLAALLNERMQLIQARQ